MNLSWETKFRRLLGPVVAGARASERASLTSLKPDVSNYIVEGGDDDGATGRPRPTTAAATTPRTRLCAHTTGTPSKYIRAALKELLETFITRVVRLCHPNH